MINRKIKIVIVGDKGVGKTTISFLLFKYFYILKEYESYDDANLAIILISEKKATHKRIDYWMNDIRKIVDIPILIVRNKCDINSKKYTIYKINHYISVFDNNLDFLIEDIVRKAIFNKCLL